MTPQTEITSRTTQSNSPVARIQDGSHAISLRIAGERYGLFLSAVREIVTLPRVTRVPNAAEYVSGVINLHGEVLPVLDLARRFHIGETEITGLSRIVVIESADETVGILATEVGKVVRIAAAALQPPPSLVAGIAAEFIDGVLPTDEGFVVFLNVDRTLRVDDQDEVSRGHED